uniref:Tubulin-specific chaperone A n=1 Tax=Parascaris univalens TaxID=6257 RepID=A0A914ZWW9_PARUN
QLLKTISIKTGVLKRITKELSYYKKEAEMEATKLESMKAQPDLDEHIIKKQAEVLLESRNMIPNSMRRMQNALEDLKKLVDENSKVLQGCEEYTAACEQIEAASAVQ